VVPLSGNRNLLSSGTRRSSHTFSRESLTSTTSILAYLAILDFAVHMLIANNYGYFRDELYYIVSGTQHLSLGYVDFPPMIAYIAAILNLVTGDSLVSIHIIPALDESLLVFVSGMIARELGGGRKAQILAAVSTLLTLGLLAEGSLFTPDSLDQLWWGVLAYLVIRIIRSRELKLWIVAGLVVGVGLLSKLTIFFFVAALLVSLLIFPSSRKYLRSKWILVGGLLSFALILPMIYWNFIHGWPMVDFYLEFRGDVGGSGPLVFLTSQISEITFLNVPILIIGLYFYLKSNEAKEVRALGLSYILIYVFMTAINMKPYYLLAAYPMIFAGGAVAIEKSTISKRGISRWFGSRPYIACLAVIAIFLAPLVMPVLPPATVLKVYGGSATGANSAIASGETGPLPQNLGDRFGWNTMVSTLEQAYDQLPQNLKSQACIFTVNYGEASAVNFLGKNLGLPEAISGHNNYYIWGPGSCTGHVIIAVGAPLSALQSAYGNVSLLTTITCQYCMNNENNLPVYLCQSPNFSSVAAFWPQTRHYD
jgi:4-amino-4-deoxy-L-arabinose transferase-like glycosyltransferase